MPKIKICGITNIKDALKACEYGADALGFVFSKSPRMIGIKAAAKIITELPLFVAKVGVFVNAEKNDVLEAIKVCKLDAVQFHGEEDDKYCAFFKKYSKIIKSFRIKDKTSIKTLKNYNNIDAFLFDSYTKNIYGGTGKTFPHKIISKLHLKKPIIIAGGINEENFRKIIYLLNPFALDISSSIELRPGKKSIKLLKNMIKAVKSMEN